MTLACRFFSGEFELAGLLDMQSTDRGAVIAHPHPLYGGDMHNTVVKTVADAYGELGYATLRFNFRGVAPSLGRHDDGAGEMEDVAAAVSFLAGDESSYITGQVLHVNGGLYT